AVALQAGDRALAVDGHGRDREQVPVPVRLEARHQRDGGWVGLGVVAGGGHQQAVDVHHPVQRAGVALGLLAQVVLIVEVAADGPVEQPHAGGGHVGDGVLRGARGAPVVVAVDAPVDVGPGRDTTAEAADRAAGQRGRDDRAVAVVVVVAIAGVVAVPGHASVERCVRALVLAVEHADLDALAGEAGLVRAGGIGRDQQVVPDAGVPIGAGLGAAGIGRARVFADRKSTRLN